MSAAVTIRRLQPEDLAGFSALITRFFEHAGNEPLTTDQIQVLFDKALSTDRNIDFMAAVAGQELVGIISITFGESSYQVAPFGWCDDFYVDPRWRSAGIGRRLLQAVAELAAQRGCSNILAAVGRDDHAAHEFYRARGFHDLSCDLLSLPLEPINKDPS
jgi:GNAT superfamily N-acetyltransferase